MRFWPIFVAAVFFLYSATGLPTTPECQPDDFSRLLEYVDDATAIKQEHLHYFKFPSDNVAFHRLANANAATQHVLYFHAENAVLKLLNDKVVGDKQVSAALSNLYKRLFFEAMMKDPVLKAQLIPAEQGGMYSDYKSIRLGFRVPDTAVGEKLNESVNRVYTQVSQQFGKELERYGSLKELIKNRTDLSGHPSHWNLAGVGLNPEQASFAARQARTAARLYTGEPHPLVAVQAYGRVMETKIKEDVMVAEDLRYNISHALGDRAMDIFDPEGIMRTPAIGLLRKTENDPSVDSEQGYVNRIRERFRERYDVVLSDQVIHWMQMYFHRVNRFAPSIYADETEAMHLAPLSGASHGVVTFDLRGAGDNNLRGAMLALKETANSVDNSDTKLTNKQVADMALAKLRRNQDAISMEFINARESIPLALSVAGVLRNSDRLTRSGDELTWLPDHDITSPEMAKALATVQRQMPPGHGLRTTQQPQQYDRSFVPLNESSRFDWSAKMDSYEKALREYLGKHLPDLLRSGQLDGIEMSMVLRPHSATNADLHVWFSLTSGRQIVPRLKETLEFHARNFAKRDVTTWEFPDLHLRHVSTFDEVIDAGERSVLVPHQYRRSANSPAPD